MYVELLLLFSAGFFGGILNSIAGGGSFITFPALLFVGVPPISANATNTFASCAGYLSGAYAFREDLYTDKKALPKIIGLSFVGGGVGAWFLLQTSESLFEEAIPWLLLFAMVLFVFGGNINHYLKQHASRHRHASLMGAVVLSIILLGVCVYGGFFNAGLGIISLSYLALAGYTHIHLMNGIKLMISSTVSLIAIAVFIYDGLIAWSEGMAVLVGTLLGGYLAAYLAKRVSPGAVKNFVIIAGSIMTLYFFKQTYL